MHYLFLIPLIGGSLLVALQLVVKGLSRITLNLWNSALATATAGALYRGIVNLSGRSTTLDRPYYYVAGLPSPCSHQYLLCPAVSGWEKQS